MKCSPSVRTFAVIINAALSDKRGAFPMPITIGSLVVEISGNMKLLNGDTLQRGIYVFGA